MFCTRCNNLSYCLVQNIGQVNGGHLGLYRLETQTTAGSGKFAVFGLGSSSAAREALKVSFDFFKAIVSRINGTTKANEHDYHVHLVELQNSGPTTSITLAGFIAACSGILQKPLQGQLVVLGDMSLGGSIKPVENLASCMQVAFDCGANRTRFHAELKQEFERYLADLIALASADLRTNFKA